MKVVSRLDRLLTLENLYALYISLGESVKNNIDIINLNYDSLSARNSFDLLHTVDFIGIRSGRYSKKDELKYSQFADFKTELIGRLTTYYTKELKSIFGGDISYDDNLSLYFIKRNAIVLDLSGLVMLLDGLGVVAIIHSDVYIKDLTILLNFHKRQSFPKRPVSIVELRNRLVIKDKLGVEAEILALEFEKSILEKEGIDKTPQMISDLDVGAGYDIVSFLNRKSTIPDKFIEVKSCSDYKYKFYISRNEINTAHKKGESYYIYLYNRKTKQFRIIQNPYSKIICNDNWAKEPEIFEVHSIT